MYFKKSFFILVLVMFLAACGSSTDTDAKSNSNAKSDTNEEEEIEKLFSDESDDWKVELSAHLKKGKEERILTLSYKGDDPKDIDTVIYDVQGTEEFNGEKTLNGQHYLTDTEKHKGDVYTKEDDPSIEVTIEWKDEEDTFELEEE
ncbi:MAG TPA: hypothetical protein VK142_10455 [Bacillota bacterium]|nr:hypothetical protein [Bacillota bacterium]